MKIGFIGVGKMGRPMALNLAKAGYAVAVYDNNSQAAADLSGTDGITVSPALVDLPAGADVVITMLPNGQIVRQVVLEIAPKMAASSILIDMSTSYPLETQSLREALPLNIELVDAPVSGGVWRAELGTLTIIAGGDDKVVDRITPILSAMGTVSRTGALGTGHAMKVLNNYLSASGLAAACEAVLIGRKFGLDPDVMADIFNTSTGRNNATEVKLKQHVNNKAYTSGFTLGLMAKDLNMADRLAHDMKIEARGLEACTRLFQRAVESLGDTEDHTAIMKLIEEDAGHV